MFCQNCGKEIRCTSKFCPGCGSALPVQKNLITAAMQGDQEAYTALYHQAEKPVRMTVYSIISPDGENNADADDIILESMVKGFQSLEQLTNPDSFTAWMRTIARNKSIDYLRKNRDITFSELVTEDGEEFEETLVSTDASSSPELAFDQKTKAALLRDILTSLPDDQRTVLVMYYYHEMKIGEIAKELGCTEATVKSRLKYGKFKVESGVGELEKKHGIKLYSFAPVLLLLLFRGAEKGLGENAGLQKRVLTAASGTRAAGVSAGTKTAASAGAKTAASVGAKVGGAALRTKIIIIAASAVLGTGAAGAGTYVVVSRIRAAKNTSAAEETAEVQPERTEEIAAPETETDLIVVPETETAAPETEADLSADAETNRKFPVRSVTVGEYGQIVDTYDEYGNIIHEVSTDADGQYSLEVDYTYEYDKEGHVLSKDEIWPESTIHYAYTLREDGLPETMTQTDASGIGYTCAYIWLLREDGQPSQCIEQWTGSWGTSYTITTEYTYDEEGRLVSKHVIDSGGDHEAAESYYTYTLNEDGTWASCDFYDDTANKRSDYTITYYYE